jgi:hypothetical protein
MQWKQTIEYFWILQTLLTDSQYSSNTEMHLQLMHLQLFLDHHFWYTSSLSFHPRMVNDRVAVEVINAEVVMRCFQENHKRGRLLDVPWHFSLWLVESKSRCELGEPCHSLRRIEQETKWRPACWWHYGALRAALYCHIPKFLFI